jgi:hypothetical protein
MDSFVAALKKHMDGLLEAQWKAAMLALYEETTMKMDSKGARRERRLGWDPEGD